MHTRKSNGKISTLSHIHRLVVNSTHACAEPCGKSWQAAAACDSRPFGLIQIDVTWGTKVHRALSESGQRLCSAAMRLCFGIMTYRLHTMHSVLAH